MADGRRHVSVRAVPGHASTGPARADGPEEAFFSLAVGVAVVPPADPAFEGEAGGGGAWRESGRCPLNHCKIWGLGALGNCGAGCASWRSP